MKGPVYNEKKTFDYLVYSDKDKMTAAMQKLLRKQSLPAVDQVRCAAIYTQLSDVENEQNGLVTYDRKVVKADEEVFAVANALMCSAVADED